MTRATSRADWTDFCRRHQLDVSIEHNEQQHTWHVAIVSNTGRLKDTIATDGSWQPTVADACEHLLCWPDTFDHKPDELGVREIVDVIGWPAWAELVSQFQGDGEAGASPPSASPTDP